jgi:hypothetical protein
MRTDHTLLGQIAPQTTSSALNQAPKNRFTRACDSILNSGQFYCRQPGMRNAYEFR